MSELETLMGEEFSGYRAVRKQEAAIASRTIAEHRDLVRLWLKALEQYHLGTKGEHPITDPDEDKRISQVVRVQFFVLASNHLQAALEDTVAGNYHHAGFSFRYVAELLIQALYIRFRPDQARSWYQDIKRRGTSPYAPRFEKAWQYVQKQFCGPVMLPMVERIYSIAKEMDNRGAHPSQVTLLQILESRGDFARIRLRYDDNHAIAYLDRGLFLTLVLLDEMDILLPANEWRAQVQPLWDERRRLMSAHYAKLAPEDKPGI